MEPAHALTTKPSTSLITAGSTLAWRDLLVEVPLPKKPKPDPENPVRVKQILSHVSGYVQPGQLLFIMGPSGSGKSTVLDALADRIKLPVNGLQYLDGKRKTPKALKTAGKYVQQTDDLLGVLTVQETLTVAASLYLADASSRKQKVLDTMDILGLTPHADTKIGNALVRGLSGGQVRRVSIGAELVASPRIMFLDEPTSGLDSATAYNVMGELRKIAKTTGMAMVITVHQPSELVFEMADMLFLISEGHTCFFGPAAEAAGYFQSLGLERPPRSSDIEWMLDLINKDFGHPETVDKCIESWPTSSYQTNLLGMLNALGVPESGQGAPETKGMLKRERMKYPVSFLQQTKVLTYRGVLNTIRNPAVLWLRFAMYLMLALMVGLVWLRLGTTADFILDINYALFYVCAFMIFMSISVLPAYLEERSVLVRERANGSYSIGAYIVAHTLYELPYVFVLALMSSSVVYWMVGFTPSARRFFIFIANMFMSLFVAESMMVLLSAMIPILIVGIAAGAMLFGLFMCVMGAFISVDRVGWWLRWVRYIALHYYSYSTFLVNNFRGTVFTAVPDNFPPFPEDIAGESVFRAQGLEERLWVNFVALIAMVVAYRLLAGLWLHMFLRGKK